MGDAHHERDGGRDELAEACDHEQEVRPEPAWPGRKRDAWSGWRRNAGSAAHAQVVIDRVRTLHAVDGKHEQREADREAEHDAHELRGCVSGRCRRTIAVGAEGTAHAH
jgi:hypothetical protein